MRKGIGAICILLGIVCVLGSVGLIVYNRLEAQNAAEVTETLLQDVHNVIDAQNGEQNTQQNTEQNVLTTEMPTVMVDGNECIGILSIPVLELELPVLTDWSYAKLKKAPCLYYGSYYESNFVIAAHNYKAHFGRLSQLQKGDVVVFTDVNSTKHYYEVVLLETLPKNATEEMINGGFDLSLYTCTIGGGSRVTVRCNSLQGSR